MKGASRPQGILDMLPTYKQLKETFCISESSQKFVQESRQHITNILKGDDKRLLLILGPCSIHNLQEAKEFALLLKDLSKKIADRFFLVMRVYFEKSRTAGGWKGFLSDPSLDGSHYLRQGIELARQFLIELTELSIPLGTEFLDPLTAFYYDDLISWGSIGARTVSSPIHRQLASALSMPIGFKNELSGGINAAMYGMITASHSHTYMSLSEEGHPVVKRTQGNEMPHLVLRGGEEKANYKATDIQKIIKSLVKENLLPQLLVDCSHQNSRKNEDLQPIVFQEVITQFIKGGTYIRGCMLESYLCKGAQPFPVHGKKLSYGISITDACLDWEATLKSIQEQYFRLNKNCD